MHMPCVGLVFLCHLHCVSSVGLVLVVSIFEWQLKTGFTVIFMI